MTSLKQKSIDAVIWNLIERYGLQGVSLVIGVILARLLTPADFGLIGIINVLFLLASVFVKSGLGKAYIQKIDADETDAGTIFVFNIFVSLLFYLILWFSAPFIASFYEQEILTNLVRITAIVLIINAFSMMQVSKLTKEVNFKRKSVISLISTLISGIAGVLAALKGYGVWSLVLQQLASAFLNALGLWVFYNWRPKLVFSISSLKTMFSFGSWILLSSILRTIFDNIYILTIGKFFPVAELGFYTKSKGYQKVVSQQPSTAISVVSFPLFSKLQNDKGALRGGMKKFMQYTLFFIAPMSALLIVIAEPLINLVLTAKWLPMVPYFQLLMIIGAFYPMHLLNGQLLNARGKAKLNFNIAMATNFLRVINIFLMYRYSVLYIIYGELIISFITLFINGYYTNKLIEYGLLDQLKDVFKILFISVLVFFIGFFMSNSILNQYYKIIITSLTFVLGYGLINYFFNREIMLDLTNIIKDKIFKN